MASAPEGEVGHFERAAGSIQVHHPNHPPEEVTGSVEHDAGEQRRPRRVDDEKEGDVSVEVEPKHRGQDDQREGGLEQFESGHRSEEPNVRQRVNHSEVLCGQVRALDHGGGFGCMRTVNEALDGCVSW